MISSRAHFYTDIQRILSRFLNGFTTCNVASHQGKLFMHGRITLGIPIKGFKLIWPTQPIHL
jgi:hypothetical protein